MDQAADGEVGHHEAVEFLADEVRGLAAQEHLAPAEMGLQFVEGRFDLPSLRIKGGQNFNKDVQLSMGAEMGISDYKYRNGVLTIKMQKI